MGSKEGRLLSRVFSIFIFFKNIFYKNIFLVSQFAVLYPYRPAEGRQGAYRPSAGWPAPCRRPALAAGPLPPLPGSRDLYVIKI